jgi:hypothetical protein
MASLNTYADICPNDFDLGTDVTTKKEKNNIEVLITLRNNSNKTMKILIKNPNIFLTTDGKEVPFIGYYYYEKCIPKLSDYKDLPPTHSTKRKINITKNYLFEKGKTYKIFVPGGYYDPTTDLYYCGKDGIAYFKY